MALTFYQAFVEVVTPEYRYWNPLSTPKPSEVEAQADERQYLEHKRNGTGGFRQGAPGRTKISTKTIGA